MDFKMISSIWFSPALRQFVPNELKPYISDYLDSSGFNMHHLHNELSISHEIMYQLYKMLIDAELPLILVDMKERNNPTYYVYKFHGESFITTLIENKLRSDVSAVDYDMIPLTETEYKLIKEYKLMELI